MTLTELVTVIAIGAVVLSMAAMTTVSLTRSDAKNLLRETHSSGARQASLWLGEALTYAASPLADDSGERQAAVQVARPDEIAFTSAMRMDQVSGKGAVSRVSVVLGSKCWTGEADPGVLHRCVQGAQALVAGTSMFCNYGASGCPAELFEDLAVARGVSASEPLFTYYLRADGGQGAGAGAAPPVTKNEVPGGFGDIIGVELKVTVNGQDESEPTKATVLKYFSINGWDRV
ncbi:MAG: hypothetical protein LBO20_04945 [Bifidobacteriaceae bacterium]|jgi:hypothetical protein|nr:hypothetical protein [Bifidobacteriaceae bacterium]